jgi:8-oxo-dGTP diphosphatase
MNTQDKTPVEVVAALLWRGNRFLIAQRPAHKARGLLWEFVGGKVEPNETKPQALVRECREELGVEIAPEDVFLQLVHAYPDITVNLTLYNAHLVSGTPQKLEHNDLRWITVAEIPQYNFCPADAAILQKLQAEPRR